MFIAGLESWGSELRMYAAPAVDLNSMSSTYTRQLTLACNLVPVVKCLLLASLGTCTQVHIYTQNTFCNSLSQKINKYKVTSWDNFNQAIRDLNKKKFDTEEN